MKSFWESPGREVRLFLGRCEDILPEITQLSPLFSACVTDPPFGLRWLNNCWDKEVPSVFTWQCVFRSLLLGAVLLAMGKPKTYHRMACNIEDAGFTIEDAIVRLYGTGRPPSRRHPRPAAEFIALARVPPSENGPSLPGINPDNARLPHGRWPTNAILSHCPSCTDTTCARDCPVFLLDDQTGVLSSGKMKAGTIRRACCGYSGALPNVIRKDTIGDSGGASRFFYCSRTSPNERRKGGGHPAAKPVDVMRWLCRLPDISEGDVILDPFMGGGATIEAAILEGKRAVGIEQEKQYFDAAVARAKDLVKTKE